MTEEQTEKKQTLLQTAKEYEPKLLRNITELPYVELTYPTWEETRTGENGEYIVTVMEVDGEHYRVPNSVLGSIKEQVKVNPNLQRFKVSRTGTTKNDTRYTVVALL